MANLVVWLIVGIVLLSAVSFSAPMFPPRHLGVVKGFDTWNNLNQLNNVNNVNNVNEGFQQNKIEQNKTSKDPPTFTQPYNKSKNTSSYDSNFLIADSFQIDTQNMVSSNEYSDIWWHNPVLHSPSYEQITNNLKYQYNPDIGNCERAEFCGAYYKDDRITPNTNVQTPLDPAPLGQNRIGYYTTPIDLTMGNSENMPY